MSVFLPNGYHQVVLTWTLDGSTKVFQTVLMGKTFPSDTALQTLLKYTVPLKNASGPCAVANMYVGWTLATVKCSQMSGGFLTVEEDLAPVIGGKAGSFGLPVNVSVLTKKITGLAGRRYRGRCMWPDLWIPEASISQAGLIDGAGQTLVNGYMTYLDTQLLLGSIVPVLGHDTSEILPTPQTSAMKVVPKVGTIRRRIRGF